MACLTDRDLFAVEHPQDTVKAGCLSFAGELPYVSYVMHNDRCRIPCCSTDATRFAQIGARSHRLLRSDQVDVRGFGVLKGISVLSPIVIEMECDRFLLDTCFVF